MDKKFFELLLSIDAEKYDDGVLGKMDAVLQLSRYGRKNVLAGLDYVSKQIRNDKARRIALDVYSSRVR